MGALERLGGDVRYFNVAERSRVLYILVPKNACTTMLWGLLELEGNDPAIMNGSLKRRISTPEEVVHDTDLYPIPTLADVSDSLRRDALTGLEWLRIAVVRNPFTRLYSAWESKVLLCPPGAWRFRDAPELIENEHGIDVGASFRSFVLELSQRPEDWLSDEHFRPQADLVPTEAIDDIELVPTVAIPDLFRRLSDRAGRAVAPRRSNEGLGIDGTALLDDETAERISELYAADFKMTGADPNAFVPGEPVFLDSVAQRLMRLARARGQRTMQLGRSYRKAAALRSNRGVGRFAQRLSQR